MKPETLIHKKIRLAAHQKALECAKRSLEYEPLPDHVAAGLRERIDLIHRDIKAAEAAIQQLTLIKDPINDEGLPQ